MIVRRESYDQLHDLATLAASNYLAVCFPNQSELAPIIATDLIDTRPTWRVADFIHLFKFLRQRAGDIKELKVLGNTVTLPKIMEMVAVYEEHRAQALEQHHAGKKGEITTKHEKLNELAEKVAQKFKDKNEVVIKDCGMGKDFDKIQAERERTGKNVLYRKEAPDERWFKEKCNDIANGRD